VEKGKKSGSIDEDISSLPWKAGEKYMLFMSQDDDDNLKIVPAGRQSLFYWGVAWSLLDDDMFISVLKNSRLSDENLAKLIAAPVRGDSLLRREDVAGVPMVRIAQFSWSVLRPNNGGLDTINQWCEPRENCYDGPETQKALLDKLQKELTKDRYDLLSVYYTTRFLLPQTLAKLSGTSHEQLKQACTDMPNPMQVQMLQKIAQIPGVDRPWVRKHLAEPSGIDNDVIFRSLVLLAKYNKVDALKQGWQRYDKFLQKMKTVQGDNLDKLRKQQTGLLYYLIQIDRDHAEREIVAMGKSAGLYTLMLCRSEKGLKMLTTRLKQLDEQNDFMAWRLRSMANLVHDPAVRTLMADDYDSKIGVYHGGAYEVIHSLAVRKIVSAEKEKMTADKFRWWMELYQTATGGGVTSEILIAAERQLVDKYKINSRRDKIAIVRQIERAVGKKFLPCYLPGPKQMEQVIKDVRAYVTRSQKKVHSR